MSTPLRKLASAAVAAGLSVISVLAANPMPAMAANPQLTVNVNSPLDSANSAAGASCTSAIGKCTLRAAIEYADVQAQKVTPSDVTIFIPAGNYQLTIQGNPLQGLFSDTAATGDLHIGGQGASQGAINLIGAGAASTFITQTLAPPFAERVIKIDPVSAVSISGVTIRGGLAGFSLEDLQNDGAGIQVCGGSTLDLENAVVTENKSDTDLSVETSSFDDGRGGGISVKRAGTCISRLSVNGGGLAAENVKARRSANTSAKAKPAAAGSATQKPLTLQSDQSSARPSASATSAGFASINNTLISQNVAEEEGGGIFNEGLVFLTHSAVVGNSVTGVSSVTGLPDIVGSGNPEGGGIFSAGRMFAINDTITKNTVASNGAGGGGVYIEATETGENLLANVTLVGNTAARDAGGGVRVGAVVARRALIVANTIIANNTGGNCAFDAGQALADAGSNLESTNGCGFSPARQDKVNTDPGLGPLGVSHGTTPTLDPQRGSAAIDSVLTPGNCRGITDDQRGIPRPQGPFCDIGAVEVILPNLTRIDPVCVPSAGGTVTLTGTGFTLARGVTFGGNKASSFTVNSDTSITTVAPPGSGSVDVVVQGLDGVSNALPLPYCVATLPNTSTAGAMTPAALWLPVTLLAASAGIALSRRRRRSRR